MKYKCDMVKDLMPLSLDDAATEASKQVVVEHLAECGRCVNYYKLLGEEIEIEGSIKEPENKYVTLADRIRKRNRIVRASVILFMGVIIFLCMNYASGYRFDAKKAADISGRLNDKSKVIGNYKWKADFCFYIYDSYSCYDVVAVEKTWHGWKRIDNFLNFPKWKLYDENVGIEITGALYHFRNNEGIQLFPVIVQDSRVKTVEVTCFGETKMQKANCGELMMFTFETEQVQENSIEAAAYDDSGDIIYTLEEEKGRWIWALKH